jgi:hypothetical protein
MERLTAKILEHLKQLPEGMPRSFCIWDRARRSISRSRDLSGAG